MSPAGSLGAPAPDGGPHLGPDLAPSRPHLPRGPRRRTAQPGATPTQDTKSRAHRTGKGTRPPADTPTVPPVPPPPTRAQVRARARREAQLTAPTVPSEHTARPTEPGHPNESRAAAALGDTGVARRRRPAGAARPEHAARPPRPETGTALPSSGWQLSGWNSGLRVTASGGAEPVRAERPGLAPHPPRRHRPPETATGLRSHQDGEAVRPGPALPPGPPPATRDTTPEPPPAALEPDRDTDRTEEQPAIAAPAEPPAPLTAPAPVAPVAPTAQDRPATTTIRTATTPPVQPEPTPLRPEVASPDTSTTPTVPAAHTGPDLRTRRRGHTPSNADRPTTQATSPRTPTPASSNATTVLRPVRPAAPAAPMAPAQPTAVIPRDQIAELLAHRPVTPAKPAAVGTAALPATPRRDYGLDALTGKIATGVIQHTSGLQPARPAWASHGRPLSDDQQQPTGKSPVAGPRPAIVKAAPHLARRYRRLVAIGIGALSAVLAVVLVLWGTHVIGGHPHTTATSKASGSTSHKASTPRKGTTPKAGAPGATAWSTGRTFKNGDYSLKLVNVLTGLTQIGTNNSWTAENGQFVIMEIQVTYTAKNGSGTFPPSLQELVTSTGKSYGDDLKSAIQYHDHTLDQPLPHGQPRTGYLAFDIGTAEKPTALKFVGNFLDPAVTIPLG